MTWRVRIAAPAAADIASFSSYLANHSPEVAERYIRALDFAIHTSIAEQPLSWQFFFLTGAPYRAHLFPVGRRVTYWIVFRVDEEARIIRVVRFWNSARDPLRFSI